jgi:hypothetical protein
VTKEISESVVNSVMRSCRLAFCCPVENTGQFDITAERHERRDKYFSIARGRLFTYRTTRPMKMSDFFPWGGTMGSGLVLQTAKVAMAIGRHWG